MSVFGKYVHVPLCVHCQSCKFLSPDLKIVIPLRISCVMAQSLLFITVLLSEPLAVLQPMRAISPPPSISFSLSPACSFSLPAPAGLRDQEPALPWQLVLSLSLNRSSLDRCLAARQTLYNAHPTTTNTSFATDSSDGFKSHFLRIVFSCCLFSLYVPVSGCGSLSRVQCATLRFVCHAHMDYYWQWQNIYV
ncbi:hypothetical protein GOODEAATRI_022622 [Goodea atripinnis]|uniref:Uncharacterized protein n=1 Tax=Goodea atripinnis TaxID=208336 RepID=A0ABV0PQV0_9TELE